MGFFDDTVSGGGVVTDDQGYIHRAVLNSYPDYSNVEAVYTIDDGSAFNMTLYNTNNYYSIGLRNPTGTTHLIVGIENSIYIRRSNNLLCRHDADTLELLVTSAFSELKDIYTYKNELYVHGKQYSSDAEAKIYRLNRYTLAILAVSTIGSANGYGQHLMNNIQFTSNGMYVRYWKTAPYEIYRLDLLNLSILATSSFTAQATSDNGFSAGETAVYRVFQTSSVTTNASQWEIAKYDPLTFSLIWKKQFMGQSGSNNANGQSFLHYLWGVAGDNIIVYSEKSVYATANAARSSATGYVGVIPFSTLEGSMSAFTPEGMTGYILVADFGHQNNPGVQMYKSDNTLLINAMYGYTTLNGSIYASNKPITRINLKNNIPNEYSNTYRFINVNTMVLPTETTSYRLLSDKTNDNLVALREDRGNTSSEIPTGARHNILELGDGSTRRLCGVTGASGVPLYNDNIFAINGKYYTFDTKNLYRVKVISNIYGYLKEE